MTYSSLPVLVSEELSAGPRGITRSGRTMRNYFQNCFVLGRILGSGRHPLSRFLAVLILWIAAIAATCWADGIFDTDGQKIIGLRSDPLFISLCILLPTVVWAVLHLLKRLEETMEAIPKFVDGSDLEQTKMRIDKDIADVRDFVSIETRSAKSIYRSVMFSFVAVFVLTQIINPFLLHFTEKSWALAPDVYPRAFILACLWSFFWSVIVAGNICWIVFGVLILAFKKIVRNADEGKIMISPLLSTQADAVSRVGVLALANAMFFSCGLFVLIPWVWRISTGLSGLIYVAAYLISMIVVGIIPIWIVSRAIKKAQIACLKILGTSFNHYLSALISELRHIGSKSSVSKTIVTPIGELAVIDAAYSRVDKMSTWLLPGKIASIFLFNVVSAVGTAISLSKQLQELLKLPEFLKLISDRFI